MPIKVRGYLSYKEIIGEQSINLLDGQTMTISGLLTSLANRLSLKFSESIYDPQTEMLREHVAVIINGCSYRNLPNKLDTQLKDRDEVAIFPPMAGG